MQQDIINIDLKLSAGWEALDNPLTLGKKEKTFSLSALTQSRIYRSSNLGTFSPCCRRASPQPKSKPITTVVVAALQGSPERAVAARHRGLHAET